MLSCSAKLISEGRVMGRDLSRWSCSSTCPRSLGTSDGSCCTSWSWWRRNERDDLEGCSRARNGFSGNSWLFIFFSFFFCQLTQMGAFTGECSYLHWREAARVASCHPRHRRRVTAAALTSLALLGPASIQSADQKPDFCSDLSWSKYPHVMKLCPDRYREGQKDTFIEFPILYRH